MLLLAEQPTAVDDLAAERARWCVGSAANASLSSRCSCLGLLGAAAGTHGLAVDSATVKLPYLGHPSST